MELYATIFFGLAQFLHHFNYTRQMTNSESETYVHDAQKQRTNDWKKINFLNLTSFSTSGVSSG